MQVASLGREIGLPSSGRHWTGGWGVGLAGGGGCWSLLFLLHKPGGTNPRLTRTFLSLAAENLSRAQSGSSLSLASAATTEPESVHSGGTPAPR